MSSAVQTPCVYVVDDDEAVRSGLCLLLRAEGYRSQAFTTAAEFLLDCTADCVGCVLLDVRMPGLSGLEVMRRLQDRQIQLPVIILTGHADVPMAVGAMKDGAFDFIQKPFNDDYLLKRVAQAVQSDLERRDQQTARIDAQERVAALTPREQQVLDRLVDGQANKVIALELGLSERTVELHRAHVLQKLQVKSLAQLVQVAMRARGMQIE